MSNKKLKVVWICHFTDSRTRDYIHFDPFYFKTVINKVKGEKMVKWRDKAVWISNAIKEFEQFYDIELTIIFPHVAIKGEKQEFTINGIHYMCFRSEDDHLIPTLRTRLFHKPERKFLKNRKLICNYILQLSPDIVHVIGAENPYYSLSALDVPPNIPLVVSLQTLMSNPDFLKNYNIDEADYLYRSKIEIEVIKRSDYIAPAERLFKDYINNNIKSNGIFLQMSLALGQEIDISLVDKEYDFVYFATNIEKAGDFAIEAFSILCSYYPQATLNMSGFYTTNYKSKLDTRLKELGIVDNVIFTGQQPTHEDVLRQIKKSRFALLPLKIDLISGTIREAMACGLPVVTTITPATPDLNLNRESVMLSEKGDFTAMADNMKKLIEDDQYASQLRKNAIITIQEKYSNKSFMMSWRLAYHEIIDNFSQGKAFSKQLLFE